MRNSQGERIEYTLDLEGNRIAESTYSASGELVRNQRRVYDELSRLLSHIGANGQTSHYQYDKNGNRTGLTDAMNNKTGFAFDALNRLIATTDANDGVIEQAYNAQGKLVSVTDQRGLTTQYRYNGFGDKVAQISPDTGETRFEYNEAGHVIAKSDARGVETQYRYDVLGRMLHIHYPAANDEDILYHYDQVANAGHSVGRLTQVVDSSGSTDYHYNQRGQVTQQQYVIGDTRYSTENIYNSAGNLMGTRYPSGRYVEYQNDIQGRIVALSSRAKHGEMKTIVGNLDYTPFGPVAQMDYHNGVQLNIQRDQDYRIDSIKVGNAANDSNSFGSGYYDVSYIYDDSGNITAINDGLNDSRNQNYAYDNLYRLISADGSYGFVEYQYDEVGNRLSRRIRNKDTDTSLTEAYEYSHNSNRLTSVAKHQGANTEYRVLNYDAVGNIVNDQQAADDNRALIYGANNRLQQVSEAGKLDAVYTYNALGQRVSKVTTQADGAKVTTHFHYNQQKQLIAETDVNGLALKEYLYVGDERVAMVDYDNNPAGQMVYIHNDHLGTPQLMTDAKGVVVWRANRLPFGESVVAVTGIDLSLQFPGQYADDETGYYQNYFQDYDPSLGRYIQSDPIGLLGGVNTFGYVSGNPISKVDHLGLLEWNGTATNVGATAPIGAAYTRYELTSEWVNNQRATVVVHAVGPAVGLGADIGGTYSEITFREPLNYINPNIFDGSYDAAQVSWSVGNAGYGAFAINMGDAGAVGHGQIVFGWDVGATYSKGTSTVLSVKYEKRSSMLHLGLDSDNSCKVY
ncbi:RHS repeat-associated core domain-containing protein [Bacterioplanoides sp.]|uniref:RHS repeat-associated core domain-containing protein n=1 Tax=Bacterioplanoides sp. TaxID=2066072 RepID=UPI003AFFD763